MRGKIADIQVFLTSDACSEAALMDINTRLDGIAEVMSEAKEKKAGGERCGKS